MGRKPIGKRAMTDAERQRKRRQRLRRERAANEKRAKRRAKATTIPSPPGITYWREVLVQTAEGEKAIIAPTTRPLAACDTDLSNDEVRALARQIAAIAKRRGIAIEGSEDA